MSQLEVFHYRGGPAGFPASTPHRLVAAVERSFLASLANGGAGRVVLMFDDPEASHIAPGDVLAFDVDDERTFAILASSYEHVRLDPSGNDAARRWTWTGTAHLARLKEGLVLPPRDANRDPITEDITYDYSHPDYDDSAWGFANVLSDVESMQVDTGGGWGPWAGWAMWSPDRGEQMGFRPIDAGILGPSDGTVLGAGMGASSHYFRDTFDVGSFDGSVLVFFAVDNTGVVSIDGRRVLSAGTDGDKQTSGFLETHTATISVSPGTHTIAVECTNYPPVTLNNPVGFSASVWIPGYGPINPPRLLWSSSGGMRMLDYQDEAPGMTFGRASRLALAAEQALGRLTDVVLSYDDDVDSDGNAWPTVNISTRVGVTLYDLFVECMATHVDVEMDPSSWTINAWVKGEKGGDPGVTFGIGNLTSLTHRGEDKSAAAILARWKGGWHDYGSGTPHESIDLGTQDTVGEVDRILAELVAIHGDAREEIGVTFEPAGPEDTPWVNPDLVLGATVTVPDSSDAPLTARILQLGATQTDQADRALFAVTVQDVILGEQERVIQAITR